jgi:nucleoporin GLE1
MASITSTPPSEASPTQYMVLKAMVENYEQRFFNFYGNAALAALRVALVDFPNRALEQGPACSALAVLADKLKRDKGLDLRG